jgi:hypothetical protein
MEAVGSPPGEVTVAEMTAQQDLVPERLRIQELSVPPFWRPTYLSLKGKRLSIAEKNWLCEEASGMHEPRWDQTVTKMGLTRRYELYSNFFKKNLDSFKKSGSTKVLGRPAFGTSATEFSQVASLLAKRRSEGNETDAGEELRDLFSDFKKARKGEQNLPSNSETKV